MALLMGFGWVGVQLFFTLSGFLIGGHIFESIDRGTFSFGRFYASRSFRILPAAYVAMAIFSFAFIGFNLRTLLNVTFTANFQPRLLFHPVLWSLCVEEQFYLLFPALAYFLCGRDPAQRVRRLTAIVLGVFVLRAAAVLVVQDPVVLSRWYRHASFHADFLLLGVLAAVLRKHGMPDLPRFLKLWWLIPAGYAGLAWITEPMNRLRPSMDLFGLSAGYPLIALWCFLLVLCATAEESRMTRFLSASVFRWTAALSYSMYLFHLKVNDKIHPFLNYHIYIPYPDRPYFAVAVSYGMMMAGAVYYAAIAFLIVERPFLLLRDYALDRAARKAEVAALAGT